RARATAVPRVPAPPAYCQRGGAGRHVACVRPADVVIVVGPGGQLVESHAHPVPDGLSGVARRRCQASTPHNPNPVAFATPYHQYRRTMPTPGNAGRPRPSGTP